MPRGSSVASYGSTREGGEMIFKRHPKPEDTLQIIIDQGEKILDRLDKIDDKIEEQRKRREEKPSDEVN